MTLKSLSGKRRRILQAGLFLILLVIPYCSAPIALVSLSPLGNRIYAQDSQLGVQSSPWKMQYSPLASAAPSAQAGRLILILVELADKSYSTSAEAINSTVFMVMADYFRNVSYGSFAVVGNITSWIHISNNTSVYGHDYIDNDPTYIDDGDGDFVPDAWELIRDAVHLVDNSINFALYDHIIVVHSGGDQAKTHVGDDIWSSSYSQLEISTNDGVTIDHAVILSEFDPMGIYAHEFGHDLGLPDLYNIKSTPDNYVGSWDLMAEGAWLPSYQGTTPSQPTSWCRMQLGWINSSSISEGRMISAVIDRLEYQGTNFTVMKIPITIMKYYLVEVRFRIGYDAYLPSEGVLMLYCDDSLESGMGIVKVVTGPRTLDQAAFTESPGRNMFVDDANNINITVVDAYSTSYRVSVNLIRQDNTPPTVSVSGLSSMYLPNTPVSVEAIITDIGANSSSVKNATLMYSSDGGGSWNQLEMNPTQDGVYTSIIPPQKPGEVRFYIQAYDYAGNLIIDDNNGQYFRVEVVDVITVALVVIIGLLACVAALAYHRTRELKKEKAIVVALQPPYEG